MFFKNSNIIVSLCGGLGNQMFQYAAGRYLSFHQNCKLQLDIAAYSKNNFRKFQLDNFNIKGKYIRATLISRFLYKIKIKTGIYKSYEETFPFDVKKFKNISKNTILNGYWQSEKYFAEIKNLIRKDFTFKERIVIDRLPIVSQINQSTSVAVHIRRGDYLLNKNFNSVYGICSEDYYKKSIAYIIKKINLPVFYFFSDDIDWVKDHIKLSHPSIFIDDLVYKGSKIDHAIIDLYLMSRCKHNIIANSSFSWWGAWLNGHSDKIVVSPKGWFNNSSNNYFDIILDDWIRI